MTDMKEKLAIQMYTIHEAAWSDLTGTLEAVSAMGYRGVEYYGRYDTFDKNEILRVHKQSGLALTSWHVEWADLQSDAFDETIAYMEDVGCPIVVVPCLGGEWHIAHSAKEECREVWLRHIDWLNDLNKRLSVRGIRLSYHNHDHEFETVYDGKCVFDLLWENLDDSVILEFDTGRALKAGADPLDVLSKYRNREILMHIKPYSRTRGYDTVLGASDDLNDIQGMCRAYQGNFLWWLVESENRQLPELDNAAMNLAYCRTVGDQL